MRLARRLWASHGVQLHRRPVRAVNFDGRGARLCTASEDGTAKVFEVDTGKLLKECEISYIPVHHVICDHAISCYYS